nr:CvpA family protein [Gallionella sp.]MDD4957870.1 CvpA family protein [Gallionella sp.]
MNLIDAAVIVIIGLSVGIGWMRGFVYELLSMFGWPIAYFMSKTYANNVAAQLPNNLDLLLMPVTYSIIFIVTLIVWGLIILGFFKLVRAVGLGRVDKALGMAFGLIRAVIVLLALVLLCGLSNLPEQAVWTEAVVTPFAEDMALQNKPYLPQTVAQHIHYKNRY